MADTAGLLAIFGLSLLLTEPWFVLRGRAQLKNLVSLPSLQLALSMSLSSSFILGSKLKVSGKALLLNINTTPSCFFFYFLPVAWNTEIVNGDHTAIGRE